MEIKRIGLYGTGKVALSFGYLLKAVGFVPCYFGRSIFKPEVQSVLKDMGAHVADDPDNLIQRCDAIGIVVTDRAIQEVAATLHSHPDKYIFHMSGALGSSVLESKGQRWKGAFSFHPLRAFAKVEKDLSGTTFALEISKDSGQEACEQISAFAEDVKKKGENIRLIHVLADQKVLYHASAVIASNLVVPLVDLANQQLRNIGIEDETLLWPLIDSAVANMKKLGVKNSLTGPAQRGDFETIKSHLAALDQKDTEIYSALTYKALELSKASEENKEKIRRLLRESLATTNSHKEETK